MSRGVRCLLGVFAATTVGMSPGALAIAHGDAHQQERLQLRVHGAMPVPLANDPGALSGPASRDDAPAVAAPDAERGHEHAIVGPGLVGHDTPRVWPPSLPPTATALESRGREHASVVGGARFARAGPSGAAPSQPRAPPTA